MNELISIIITVYNIEDYLPQCLQTVEAQTYQELEIIIVNDGSTDRSGEICNEFCQKEKRTRVVHQQNQGPGPARNIGLQMATGEYVAFVDGDDYLHRDAIRVLYDAIKQDANFDISICGYKMTEQLNEDIDTVQQVSPQLMISREELISNLLRDRSFQWVTVWGKLYRREPLSGITFKNYQQAEDIDFNLRVFASVNKAVWVQTSLYYYVQRPTSIVYSVRNDLYHHLVWLKIISSKIEHLASSQKSFQHQLLQKLYRQIVLAKGRAYKTEEQAAVFQECQKYMHSTRKAYWQNRHIPLYEKIGVTLLLHAPRLTRWLMIKTKNY